MEAMSLFINNKYKKARPALVLLNCAGRALLAVNYLLLFDRC